MSVTRFQSGGVTVTLSGDLERFIRRAVAVAGGELVKQLTATAEAVSRAAESDWYDGLKRRTGRTGQFDVVTTVSETEVRIGVKSSPAARYVHRPNALSVVKRPARWADFEAGRAKRSPPGEHLKGYGVVVEPNPRASDGKYLLQELVRKPFRVQVKIVSKALGKQIVDRIKRGA